MQVEKIEIGKNLWSDDRGWGINPIESTGIESKSIGDLHTVSIKPDKVRGNHYHTKSTEWILLFGGKAKLLWRSIDDKVTHEILVSRLDPSLFKIPPNIEHAVINNDKHDIYLISISDSTDRGTVKSTLKNKKNEQMLSPAESNLLALLGKEWDITGPPGIMDISDFVVALPLSPSETLGTIKDFYSIGLIDMNTIKTAVFLTPEGYETVERERGLEQEDT